MGGRDPRICAITCLLPGVALVGSWNCKKNWDTNPGILNGMQATQVMASLLCQMPTLCELVLCKKELPNVSITKDLLLGMSVSIGHSSNLSAREDKNTDANFLASI